MIENYNEVIANWGMNTTCHEMETLDPEVEMRRWCVQKTVTILANADYYYTKEEVDKLLEEITQGGVTREEVQQMIDQAIATKANQADLEALSAQVASNTERILDTYTKPEVNSLLASYYTKLQTNSMFGNYSKVEDTTLILNSENIN